MKMTWLCFILIWAPEPELTVTKRQVAQGVVEVIAINNNYCDYSVLVDADLENMESDHELPAVRIAKPRDTTVLVTFRRKNGNVWKYKYRYRFVRGNVNKAQHSEDAVYHLPFEQGQSYRLFQGYNGQFSHHSKKALDFTMEEGTRVAAARSGRVIGIKEDSDRGCPEESCRELGNYILIEHNDGTIAKYFHLQKGGVTVEPGDEVVQGQFIGLSGNTGWSTGPHLHFEVYRPEMDGEVTLETYFSLKNGERVLLREGRKYSR